MMEQNDQYLKALDSHLEGHLSDDLRAKRIQEICTHLTMDQADRQAHGSDVDTAAREARRTLGSPEVLARQLVRQARGYDSAPAWRLSLACGIALTLSTVAMFWVNPLNQYMPVWSVNGLHWVQFMALVYFGFLVVRTQRWLVWPIAGWLVVASIGMDTFILNKLPPVMPSSPKVQAQVLATTRRLMADQKMVDDWQQGRAPVDQAPVAQAVFFLKEYPPLVPLAYSRQIPSYTLKHVAPAEASRLWKANGKGFEESLQISLNSIQLGQAMREHASQPWRALLPVLARTSIIVTAERVAIFAVVNGILLLLAWVGTTRKTRRDPLLA